MTRIPVEIAIELKKSGLQWKPSLHDEFVIPDRGMDDRVFVLSDLQSTIQTFQGIPVVSFHGNLEWALDMLIMSDVVWIPSEGQLRNKIIEILEKHQIHHEPTSSELGPKEILILKGSTGSYRCEILLDGRWHFFKGETAPLSYAQALLYLL